VLGQAWRWQDNDVLLHALPIFHVHGLFVALHCALLHASPMLFHDRFDPGAVMRDLPDATVFMGVPTFYTRLLGEASFDAALCNNMRLFISGSAPLLDATFTEFEQRTGHTILERYGMTEALMVTSNPYDGPRIAGSVGMPLPGISARVIAEGGKPAATGEPGVLEFKGPNLFSGYWRNPEKTAEDHTADGYFISGDIATQDSAGFIRIVGRAKDLIISGGYNIYPKEIELAIDALDGVFESAVIGVPHPDFGESVVAVVVPEPGFALQSTEIAHALASELAAFKRPKQIVIVDELPRNAMGKVQKAELRALHKDAFAAAAV
jgi:malonyl-CoA/methylmalonyl-CoA synthetase